MALFNVTPKQLEAQLVAARRAGLLKACLTAEQGRGLPSALLLAVASRETNCRDVVGDGGHGRGVFQIDDRFHAAFLGQFAPSPTPPIPQAADYAAGLLVAAMKAGKKLKLGGDGLFKFTAAAYNAGIGGATAAFQQHGDPDRGTTGRNYGDDVVTRWHMFQAWLGADLVPAPADVLPLLLPGARGRAVVDMKALLKAWYDANPPAVPFAATPVYGRAAVEAVKEFQRRNGLDDDGKVGRNTWGALRGEGGPLTDGRAKQVPPAPAHVSFPNTLYPRPDTWNGLQPWIVPQVKAICERFGLTVTAGWSDDTVHATRSDHKWGGAVDLVGSKQDMVACTLWADRYLSGIQKPGTVFRWVGGPAEDESGVEPGHLDHVHLSWYREGAGTSIFTTPEFR
jgi:peptidoglycan hydrolase-like protein with peptidoglycan-binding domain